MARNKSLQINIDGTDLPNYPDKRIRDNDGSGNGTPINEVVYGDIHEFFAKAMRLYAISFSGLPDNTANGYQFIQAIKSLASKNDYLLSLTSAGGLLQIPVKLGLLDDGESFVVLAAADRAAETQIVGTLDAVPVAKVVTFKGGNYLAGDYIRIVNTAAGVDLIRLADGDALNAIADDFGFLKAASQIEEDAGAINTKATTPLTNFTTFVLRVNGNPESDPFIVTETYNGLMSKEDKIKLNNIGASQDRYGTFLLGDVDTGSVGLNYPVTGDIQQAQLTQRTSEGNVVTITLNPAMADSDYTVKQYIESLGSIEFDNDIQPAVFKKVSASQFQVYFEETSGGAQNIRIHIDVIQR